MPKEARRSPSAKVKKAWAASGSGRPQRGRADPKARSRPHSLPEALHAFFTSAAERRAFIVDVPHCRLGYGRFGRMSLIWL